MDSATRIAGAIQNTGPQPVLNTQGDRTASLATGAVTDPPASTPLNSSINAKLGRLMVQNSQIVELLTRVVELLEEGRIEVNA